MPSRCAKSQNFGVIRNHMGKRRGARYLSSLIWWTSMFAPPPKTLNVIPMKYDNFSTVACDRNNISSDYSGAGVQIDGGRDIYPEQRPAEDVEHC
ncbi:hypothetical protein L484_017029 [Morus notabilis]|uniref:Uncharacterized protein n=1 Tax=Morus notabilis TaxID=981085 RepID=W9RLE3_9ROSA|nr:hypothetical protein L484_017029 [Morus notabilis]